MTMLVPIWSPLACAKTTIEKLDLDYDSQILTTLHERVSRGAELAQNYYQTWHSIFWNGSNAATKKRVNDALARIAWKVADLIFEGLDLFNRFCDEQERLETKPSSDVCELRRLFYMAEQGLLKYHSHQIEVRQLELFDVTEYEVSEMKQNTVFPSVKRWVGYWCERIGSEYRERWNVLWEKGAELFKSPNCQQLTFADILPAWNQVESSIKAVQLLRTLPLRAARKVSSILGIPQKVKGVDLNLELLRSNIRKMFNAHPDRTCEAILGVVAV
ncbi:hypothetical protein IQ249_15005 [Lusitaniella coriacea LEGE 07157]|uniref:Uncharacterized protein n=1 Tax=Lusitaniella coriacea LEGE 07157 TaxID=945747 RepID=A0A8J7DXU8_9CYAN|nr:hypothetical protein [Lusitaniella coriacea]MBE9117207.1 hypothetical protein [Lusitaniella coriacea LEGE 07157]